MSNVFVIIKMCYVHNQWYDISCATLYKEKLHKNNIFKRLLSQCCTNGTAEAQQKETKEKPGTVETNFILTVTDCSRMQKYRDWGRINVLSTQQNTRTATETFPVRTALWMSTAGKILQKTRHCT